MTTTRDQLARDLDERAVPLDVDRLAATARHEGGALRRRRRLATAAGSVAVLAVVAAGVTAALPDGSRSSGPLAADPTSPTATPSAVTPPASEPGAATARGAVAALDWALQEELGGTTSDYFGQPPSGLPGFGHDYYAQLVFDDGGGVGEVGLNVQFGMDFVSTCANSSWVVRCSSRALPGGGRLTTYDEESPAAGGPHIRRVADLRRADGVRVVVSASNGFDLSANRYDVRRAEPAFTTEQLAAVVQHAFWGDTLPARFLEAGEQLEPFREESSVAGVTPTD